MLLKHTTKEIKERNALTINPAKTCQPIGAMYAALGISRCLPHSHGSQGCCAYHRSALTRHYKEPIMASTSSFTEGSSVFGGQANLVQAIENIFSIYNPDVIAIHTTCLSETIGDDVSQIISKAIADGKVPEGKHLIYASTPSYVGSHITGFSAMTKSMVDFFSESTGKKQKVFNIIPGWIEPSDIREIKRLMDLCGLKYIVFPDTSGILDAPQTGHHAFYPKGGASISALRATGDSAYTIGFGNFCSKAAAQALDAKCKTRFEMLEAPIGLRATDRFVSMIHDLASVSIPEIINTERGQLVDMMIDMQQYLYHKRVALFGDPDILIPLTEFLFDLDMKPVYIISGTPGKEFERKINGILNGEVPEAKIKNGANADLFLLHQWIKNESVDLIIGNTYGKYIARDENIPFLRMGFPILDRVGHSYFPKVGYRGAQLLLRDILNVLLDKADQEAPEESFELVM